MAVKSDTLESTGNTTVGGILIAGSGAHPITNADGLVDGAKLQTGTVATAAIPDDAITAAKILETIALVVGTLRASVAPDGGNGLEVVGTGWVRALFESTSATKDPIVSLKTPSGQWDIQYDQSDSGKLLIRYNSTTLAYFTTTGNFYVVGDVSALTFTDRSEVFLGDALGVLQRVAKKSGRPQRGDWAEVDHDTIGEMLVSREKPGTANEKKSKAESGRDITRNIQVNSRAVLQLLSRVENLETEVRALRSTGGR